MSKTIKISIAGLTGRMGKMIAHSIFTNNKVTLVAATCSPEEVDFLGKNVGTLTSTSYKDVFVSSDPNDLLKGDVIIDFSSPESSINHAKLAAENNRSIVIGTTGLSLADEKRLRQFSDKVSIVYSSNMSVGVNLLFDLVSEAIKKAGNDWDVEILEMHHNNKIDSPSGTAISIGKIAAQAMGEDFELVSNFSRDGLVGKRKKNEIGFATMRGGSVVGEHTLVLASDNERIELTHKAENRTIFANGAVRAAIWCFNKKPGLYNMQNVLGI